MLPEPLALPLNQLAEGLRPSKPTRNVNGIQRVAASMRYHALSASKSALHKSSMQFRLPREYCISREELWDCRMSPTI